MVMLLNFLTLHRPENWTASFITIIFHLSIYAHFSKGDNGVENRRHGNYIAFQNPPFDTLTRFPNGSFTYSGTSSKMLQWIAKRFNFTYTVVAINESLEKKYGTHEALFYQLINDKDIDGIVCSFYITLDRKERMDFATFPTWYEVFRLVVPRSGEESRLFAFIRPFQPTVWLLILVSMCTTVCGMTIFLWIHKLYPQNTNTFRTHTSRRNKPMDSMKELINKKSISTRHGETFVTYLTSHMVYVINVMTNQGCTERLNRSSFRILVGFFLVGAMVLVNSYSGIVISSLTVPKMKPSIDSLEDLANNQEVGVLLRHDVSIGEQILKATYGIYKTLGDKARRNPDEQILGDPFKLNTKLASGRYAYPFVQTFTFSFVANQFKKDGKCRFKVSKPLPISPGYYYFVLKKGDSRAHSLNKGLMDFFESGLLRFWAKDVVPRAEKCFSADRQQTSARQVPIRLVDLTSAFLILGVGIGLALVTFLLENLYSKITQRRV